MYANRPDKEHKYNLSFYTVTLFSIGLMSDIYLILLMVYFGHASSGASYSPNIVGDKEIIENSQKIAITLVPGMVWGIVHVHNLSLEEMILNIATVYTSAFTV